MVERGKRWGRPEGTLGDSGRDSGPRWGQEPRVGVLCEGGVWPPLSSLLAELGVQDTGRVGNG